MLTLRYDAMHWDTRHRSVLSRSYLIDIIRSLSNGKFHFLCRFFRCRNSVVIRISKNIIIVQWTRKHLIATFKTKSVRHNTARRHAYENKANSLDLPTILNFSFFLSRRAFTTIFPLQNPIFNSKRFRSIARKMFKVFFCFFLQIAIGEDGWMLHDMFHSSIQNVWLFSLSWESKQQTSKEDRWCWGEWEGNKSVQSSTSQSIVGRAEFGE